jgi:hypothetical protein
MKVERNEAMSRKTIPHLILALFLGIFLSGCSASIVEVKKDQLISSKPSFSLTLPAELKLMNSFETPGESSVTRAYIYLKEKDKQVEEMLILQIAAQTNREAGPMTAPPLTPYTEERTYEMDKRKKGELELAYLIQSMVWNAKASSLEPIIQQGLVIPTHLALQGQIQFLYQKKYAVSIRYSRDVNSFSLKVSEDAKKWNKDSISGNEEQALKTFKETFMKMMDSVKTESLS